MPLFPRNRDAVRFLIATQINDGAVSRHFTALARELAGRGHSVVLVSSRSPGKLEQPKGVPAVCVWPSRRPTRLRDALFLRRLIRDQEIECVIGNFAAVNWMCVVGALLGVRHRLAWYHTLSSQIRLDSVASRIRAHWQWPRKRFVYALATGVLTSSEAAAADVMRVYGVARSKCRVLGWSLPDLAGGGETARSGIVCAGRMHASKGQDTLIRALAGGRSRRPDAVVRFLGNGPMRADWEKLARELGVADQCRFEGGVSHADVLRAMQSAWFTVVPSRSEAFGLVNIESMSAGAPVIASRVGGIAEIVRDGLDGRLFEPGDAAGLADRMLELLEQPDIRERMGRNARDRFLAKYAQPAAIERQADLLESMLGIGGRPAGDRRRTEERETAKRSVDHPEFTRMR